MEKKQANDYLKCPQCGGLTVNSGKTGAGSQRVTCTVCRKRFTANPKKKGYSKEIRDQAIKLHFAGASGRTIGKIMGMSKANVYNWAKKNPVCVDQ